MKNLVLAMATIFSLNATAAPATMNDAKNLAIKQVQDMSDEELRTAVLDLDQAIKQALADLENAKQLDDGRQQIVMKASLATAVGVGLTAAVLVIADERATYAAGISRSPSYLFLPMVAAFFAGSASAGVVAFSGFAIVLTVSDVRKLKAECEKLQAKVDSIKARLGN